MAHDPKWFAVHTKPQMEADADVHLRRQGYWTFYPHIRQKVRRGPRRRLIEVTRPLFARYLFVAFRGRSGESVHAVNETIGVSTVVYTPGRDPFEIPHPVMDELMERADTDGLIHQAKPAHWFKGRPGQNIELKDEAPYYGLCACIASVADLDKRNEIGIFLRMLGAERRMNVPVTAVAAVLP